MKGLKDRMNLKKKETGSIKNGIFWERSFDLKRQKDRENVIFWSSEKRVWWVGKRGGL